MGNIKNDVDEKNELGIQKLMAGQVSEALQFFLRAFGVALAARDEELQAQSLVNLLDWYRRVRGNRERAIDIFHQAMRLQISVLTKSRLYTVRAMTSESSLETIAFLDEAIGFAREGRAQDPDRALEAECFAFHRKAGIICNEGSEQEKQKLLLEIEEFLPRLPASHPEIARLNYSKALIIAPERPQEAITLLQCSAARLWTESPIDAGPYLIFAARIACESENVRARALCAQAEEFREVLGKSDSGRKYLVMLDEVKTKCY